MRRQIKWATGRAKRSTSIVGPTHDPYQRDICEITLGEENFVLTICALAGCSLTKNGKKFVEDYEGGEEFEKDVKRETGFSARWWMEKLWTEIDHHRWRANPEKAEFLREMKEIDDRLQSYAM